MALSAHLVPALGPHGSHWRLLFAACIWAPGNSPSALCSSTVTLWAPLPSTGQVGQTALHRLCL